MSADALGELAMRGNAAQATFMGVKQAAEGNVMALFNLSRAVKILWASFTPFTAIVGVLMGTWAALNAGTKYYEKQSEESKNAADGAKALSDSINELRAKQSAVTYSIDAQVKALANLQSGYESTADAANKYADAQTKLFSATSAISGAGVDLREAEGLLRAGGDQGAVDRVRADANAERKLLDYGTTRQGLEQTGEALTTRWREAMNAQSRVQGQLAPAPDITAAEGHLDALKQERAGKSGVAERAEYNVPIQNEENKLQALKALDADRIEKVQKEIAEKQKLMDGLLGEIDVNNKIIKATDEKWKATQKQLQVEDEILARKEKQAKLRAQAEAKTEAVKKSGAIREDDISAEIEVTKTEYEEAAAKASRLQERVSSPAARHAQDKADREEKYAKDKLEKQIAQAEAAKARGARGKSIDDLLGLKTARAEAAAKKVELDQLERDAAIAATQSRDALIVIRNNMQNLATS